MPFQHSFASQVLGRRTYRPRLEAIEQRVLPGDVLLNGVVLAALNLWPDVLPFGDAPTSVTASSPSGPESLDLVADPAGPPALSLAGETFTQTAPPAALPRGADELLVTVWAGGGATSDAAGSLVWQNSWEVTLFTQRRGCPDEGFCHARAEAAFGASATKSGQILDIGKPGDTGPATGTARALAASSFGIVDASEGQAAVFFWRTFEVLGKTPLTEVTVEGTLGGFLSAGGHRALVSGFAWSVAGGFEALFDPDALVTHVLDFGTHAVGGLGERTISVFLTESALLEDGTYTVAGYVDTNTRLTFSGGGALVEFFEPPGLEITVS